MVNELGDGLFIAIDAQHSWLDDWMSFASWYSFSKIIPDATVVVVVTTKSKDRLPFSWTRQLNVPVIYSAHDDWRLKGAEALARLQRSGTLLVVKPDVVAVRDLNDEAIEVLNSSPMQNIGGMLVADASSDELACFVSYRSGWGKFVVADWIHNEAPFAYVGKFSKDSPNANEVRIAKLWRQLGPIYTAVSRGWAS
jgi:hypothetical protein